MADKKEQVTVIKVDSDSKKGWAPRSFYDTIHKAVMGEDEPEPVPNTIDPPYDPQVMYEIYEASAYLQPNVSAYAANIDGHGHHFLSNIDFTTDLTSELIKEALFEDWVLTGQKGEDPYLLTDEDLEAIKLDLKRNTRIDMVKAESFFKNCSWEGSFVTLRKETRKDLEVTGNAYWEVIRNKEGQLRKFRRILPNQVRITKLSEKLYPVKTYDKKSRLTVDSDVGDRRIRTFIVSDGTGNTKQFHKPYNCQAVMALETGELFQDLKAMENKSKEDSVKRTPANEIIHFKLSSNLKEPYGVPRWVGVLPDVLGSRSASEYNYNWFREGFFVPLAILVAGGTLSPESVKRIKDFVKNSKGTKNAHKVMVIEASPDGKDLIPQMKFERLEDDVDKQDARWQTYDSNNEARIGSQFRIPSVVRGMMQKAYNRASAETALKQADEQVFNPIRMDFDWMMNLLVLPELGIHLVAFASNGYTDSDRQVLGDLIVSFVRWGILTPKEGRDLAETVFGKNFESLDSSWVRVPQNVWLAGFDEAANGGATSEKGAPAEGFDLDVNKLLAEARRLSEKAVGDEANKALDQ